MRLPISFAGASRAIFAASVIAGVVLTAPAARAASEFSPAQKTVIEKIVHDYLVTNPEVIKEAIEELEKRQKVAEAASRERAVTEQKDKLFNSPNQAVVGNPNGDVTLVEFFDYNCGYCKQSLATVAKLIEGDPKLRVVLKDFAILGPDSVETAQIATAARQQLSPEKFWEFHKKLLSTRGHIGKQQALAAAKEVGADMDRLEKDMAKPETQAALKEVVALAEQMRFDGTPSWVVGSEAFVGGLPYNQIKTKIDNVRKCGKTAC
ncbi:DsbA family protein [Methylocystis sp. WRRC1]|uniref:DsbA family protein n=1 Tax=Methylocystis sp. WRRC1 TaxID=1732014 RepID=UPI001D14375C|nr:DsbA family protein [Methylocystis sp. WRRC1]MCC3247323.1 DsbA family protein [Methylocystis sp. WRRC1]